MTMSVTATGQPYVADEHRTLDWESLVAQLDRGETVYTLSTVRPDGSPHATTVLAIWMDGVPYFCTRAESRKGRNLVHNPRCVLSAVTDRLDFVLEGDSRQVKDEQELSRVADQYRTIYGWHPEVREGAFYADGAPTAGPPPFTVFQVEPRRAFAFGKDEHFPATRWNF